MVTNFVCTSHLEQCAFLCEPFLRPFHVLSIHIKIKIFFVETNMDFVCGCVFMFYFSNNNRVAFHKSICDLLLFFCLPIHNRKYIYNFYAIRETTYHYTTDYVYEADS